MNPDKLNHPEPESIPIKIVSIIGGILASTAFVGFLFIAGLYDSAVAQLSFGVAVMGFAIWIDKTYHSVLLDTISISLFLIGAILLGIALEQFGLHFSITCLFYILISLFTLFITQNQVLSLVALLSVHASIVAIILTNDLHELMLIYIPSLAVLSYFAYNNRDWFLTKGEKADRLYPTLRTALTLSFISMLYFVGIRYTIPIAPEHYPVASIGIIVTTLYLTNEVWKELNIGREAMRIRLLIGMTLLLLPTVFAPSISGSIFLLLLAFRSNYKTGLVLGIMSTVYFISQYYYDLSFTLLTKSILLLASGFLFLLLYFFIVKNMNPHEKQ